MKDAHRALQTWIARLTMRSVLSTDDIAAITALPGEFRDIRANRDFVRSGQRVEHSCLIVSGVAARFGQTRQGDRQLTALHIPGDMADLHSAVLPDSPSALTALSDTVIYAVPHAAVHQLGLEHPAVHQAMWRDCTVDAAIAAEWLLNNGRRNATARLAHLLCELALRYAAIGSNRDRFRLDIKQVHLADAVGLTSVHVNRVLRQLRERGLILLRDRNLEILDWPALVAAAEFDPGYLHLKRENPDVG